MRSRLLREWIPFDPKKPTPSVLLPSTGTQSLQLLKVRSSRATKRDKCDWQTTKFGEQVDGPIRSEPVQEKQRRMRRSRGVGRRCRRHRKKRKQKDGEGGKSEAYSLCCRKWVKRQVERATNLNHRQLCAIRFNEIVLKPPNATSIFTFSVFRFSHFPTSPAHPWVPRVRYHPRL